MSVQQSDSLASRSAHRLHQATDDIITDARTEMRGRLDEGREAVQGLYQHGRERADQVVGGVRGYLRGQTFVTLGVGVAVGFLLRRAIRFDRRRSEQRTYAPKPRTGET